MTNLARPRSARRHGATVAAIAALAGALTLLACSDDTGSTAAPVATTPTPAPTPTPTPVAAPDPATMDADIKAAFVVIGDQNQAIARAITGYTGQCPQIVVDGTVSRMLLRVNAATVPLRTTASAAADSKPSEFPVAVCETKLPAGIKTASIGSRVLPMPVTNPQKIVILADTGCRMKKSSNTFQACNDPDQWPMAKIAATASAMKPDLVIHIGDYHYRENACPGDVAGCAGSPWGYGWDTWNADVFSPSAKLLAAAPWVVVRGNHEECARAGQGWFRFLDTAAFDVNRSCDDPSNDNFANYSYPYAVKVGTDTQFVVFDTAKVGTAALKSTDPQYSNYTQEFQRVASLTANTAVNSIFANHHPILAYAPVAGANPAPGNAALQSVMTPLNGNAYYPPGVEMVLHGHVHDFQAVNFASDHPATIVAGNGGDNLDVNFPDPFPTDQAPAPNTTVGSISHTSTYGFMTMERIAGGNNWTFKAYKADGTLLATCTQAGKKVNCDKQGYIAP